MDENTIILISWDNSKGLRMSHNTIMGKNLLLWLFLEGGLVVFRVTCESSVAESDKDKQKKLFFFFSPVLHFLNKHLSLVEKHEHCVKPVAAILKKKSQNAAQW